MQNQKGTDFRLTYKHSFWALIMVFIARLIIGELLEFGSGADEIVLKRPLPQGDWLYVTHYGAMATDLDTLRFYISKPIEGDDADVLSTLNKASEFLITDSAFENVHIHDTANGLGINVEGAIYRYSSKEYVTEGDQLRAYRITLTQLDDHFQN